MHARIENGKAVEYPVADLKQRLPDASLPADLTNDAALPAGYVYVHPTGVPEHNPDTHFVEAGPPQFDGKKWVQGWLAKPFTAAMVAEREQARAADARSQRAQQLAECDYTQLPDYPGDKAAWAAYRQALRDITKQAGFPHQVEWPSAPQ